MSALGSAYMPGIKEFAPLYQRYVPTTAIPWGSALVRDSLHPLYRDRYHNLEKPPYILAVWAICAHIGVSPTRGGCLGSSDMYGNYEDN